MLTWISPKLYSLSNSGWLNLFRSCLRRGRDSSNWSKSSSTKWLSSEHLEMNCFCLTERVAIGCWSEFSSLTEQRRSLQMERVWSVEMELWTVKFSHFQADCLLRNGVWNCIENLWLNSANLTFFQSLA